MEGETEPEGREMQTLSGTNCGGWAFSKNWEPQPDSRWFPTGMRQSDHPSAGSALDHRHDQVASSVLLLVARTFFVGEAAELALDKGINFPVHHPLNVARLDTRAEVFHHLVRLEDV